MSALVLTDTVADRAAVVTAPAGGQWNLGARSCRAGWPNAVRVARLTQASQRRLAFS